MTTRGTALLNHALYFASQGWRVLPLHTPTPYGCSCRLSACSSVGKHPRTQNGVHDATTNEARIRRWWRMWPEANIGVACGEVSGIVVLDIDPRNDGLQSLSKLVGRYGALPKTVKSKTGGGGSHWFFRYPIDGIGKSVLSDGVDLVSDGGYVILPPSKHQSGRSYRWQDSKARLAPMPQWIRDVKEARRARRTRGFTLDEPSDLREIGAGQRNVTFIRIAGAMRRWGLGVPAIDAALQIHNREVCKPPMSKSEVAKIAKNAGRYRPEYGQDEQDEGQSVSIQSRPLAS